ncbi:MAG: acyl carrier protein [Clostridia bacterium]|nr:acyl carrier protein [Clostridia bacterium]
MLEKVSKLLAEQLNVAEEAVTPEKEIIKDLGADSLDIVELMMALEDEYGVTLPDDEVVDVKTVQDIVDMLAKIEK